MRVLRTVIFGGSLALVAAACTSQPQSKASENSVKTNNTTVMADSFAAHMEALEKVYGKANSTGWGSAVFHQSNTAADSAIADLALSVYKQFLGEKLNAESQERWMAPWKKVYERPAGATPDLLQELQGIQGFEAKQSIPLLTELIENAEAGKLAMAAAFNQPDVAQLVVHTLGDGEAMTGVMVTAKYKNGNHCSVVAMMD